MTRSTQRRVQMTLGVVAVVAAVLTGCGAPGTQNNSQASTAPAKPAKPLAITILDGAGDLAVTRPTLDAFVKAHPELISSISYQSAAAPDVAGKIKAQQIANSVDISLVFGGPDVLGAGQQQDLFTKQLPEFASSIGDLGSIQDEPMQQFQALADGLGVMKTFDPAGPLLASIPTTVSSVPDTPETLLAWAKAHPGKFSYAQPPNSGPGRTFMMSLPYMLGDKDPSDPVKGWDKTWAYLAELGKYVSSYPASTTILDQQFAAGQLELIPTTIGFDTRLRREGTWPANVSISLFKDQNWVADAHFMMVPKGVSAETLYVVLALEKELLSEKSQAALYNGGQLTTANKNVTPAMADAEAQQIIAKFGRPEFYPKALKTGKTNTPLSPANLQKSFDEWQRNVGSKVGN